MPFHVVPRVARHEKKERRRRAIDAFRVAGDGIASIQTLFLDGRYEGRYTSTGVKNPVNPEQVAIAVNTAAGGTTVLLPTACTYSGSEFLTRNSPQGMGLMTVGTTIDTYNYIYHYSRDHGLRLLGNTDGWWILKEQGNFREQETNTIRVIANSNGTVQFDDTFIEVTANASTFTLTFPNPLSTLSYGRHITVKKKNASVGNVNVNIAGVNTVILNAQYDHCTVAQYRTGMYKVISKIST